jgi:sugar fermentation stimulation protein A
MIQVPIPGPLVAARFIERPNRFLIRCRVGVSGEVVDAHMADPGRLRELLVSDREIWLRPAAAGATRRTRWTAVLSSTDLPGELVSVDTTLANRLVGEAFRQGALEEFAGWTLERAEWPHGRSRFDFLLAGPGGQRLAVEVKSVTLEESGIALFPDAVTARGARHLTELAALAAAPGWGGAVLFAVQRTRGTRVEAAAHIDPAFARALAAARAAGVRILARRCTVALDSIRLGPAIPA